MKNISIKLKLIALIFIILVPLTALQGLRIKNSFNQSLETEMDTNEDYAEAISLSFTNYLEEIWTGEYSMGSAIVSNPQWSPKEIESYISKTVTSYRGVLGASWVSPDGTVLASSAKSMNGRCIRQREFIQRIVDGDDKVLSSLILSYNTNEAIMPVARAIRVDGNLQGIVVTLVDISNLHNILPAERHGKNSTFGIVDSDGMIVLKSGTDSIPFEKRHIESDSPAWKALSGQIQRTYSGKLSINGSRVMGVDYPIKSIGWECFVTTSLNDLLQVHKRDAHRDILVLALVYLGSFLFALLLGKRIINSINKLKTAAEAVSKGNLSIRTNFQGNDELAATSHAFDRMTEEIHHLLYEAEEYNRLKSQFFATVSHELKTPLNIILGAVQLIEKLDEQGEVTLVSIDKYTKILKQNSFRLLRLINNLIDINCIEGKHFSIKLSNNDIVKVVEDITQSVVEYTKLKNIEIIFDTEIEEKIIAFDPDKMERIILNLLSNSIKFTESGGKIEVNIYNHDDTVAISIKDTGIGIPQDMLHKIFDCFTQVDSSLRRKTEGSGIGLSLVKSLVEMHGGTISVYSQTGKGSEFIIELPSILTVEENLAQPETFIANVERINIEFSDIYL